MKIFLRVVGALVVTAAVIFALVIGFDWKHNPVERAHRQAADIERLINTHNLPPRVATALRRIENSAEMHASLAGTLMTGSIVEVLKADHVLNDAQVKMIEDAARLLEKPDLTRKDAQGFFEQHQDVLPQTSRSTGAGH
jgi:hypothetical protein